MNEFILIQMYIYMRDVCKCIHFYTPDTLERSNGIVEREKERERQKETWRDRGIARYGVATVSRIDKMISLFCRILSLL